MLAVLFAAEALLFSVWLDNASLASQNGFLPRFLGQWDAWIVRGVVGAAAIFFTFAYLKNKAALSTVSAEAGRPPVRWTLLAAHVGAMALFAFLSQELFGGGAGPLSPNVASALWLLVGVAGFLLAAFAFVAPTVWLRLLVETGYLSIYTVAAVTAACLAGAYIRELWAPMGRVTFALVELLLRPFLAEIVADPVKMTLGSPKFRVDIAPECSGFEGVGLILAFGVLWLCLFRREIRFPHALLLLPAGVVTIFLLNAVRLAALILIGDAGAPQIALGGFHSQAGWISFNIVALAFAVAARRVPWLTTAEARAQTAPAHAPTPPPVAGLTQGNPTAAFLLPFLSILLAGILATAVISRLYGCIPFASSPRRGLLAIRKRYRPLDWRVTGLARRWASPFSRFGSLSAHDRKGEGRRDAGGTGGGYRNDAAGVRLGLGYWPQRWTTPLAEKLALRGYLPRRFTLSGFRDRAGRILELAGAGRIFPRFGLLHGQLGSPGCWPGFCTAGRCFGAGRFGDAVAAHAVTNALLARLCSGFRKVALVVAENRPQPNC